MTDAKRTGRLVGVMFLLQLVGLMAGFIMLDALRSTDYLSTAAANSFRIKLGLSILLANGALTVGISIAAWRVFRGYSQPMAIWLLVLSVIMFLLQAVDVVHIMTMLGLSQRYIEAGGNAEIYEVAATSARLTRRFAHYLELFAIDFWLMMFYSILLRFGIIARVVAGAALATVLLHLAFIPIPGFFGYGINTNLGVPMAIGMLAVAVWLVAKGFREV